MGDIRSKNATFQIATSALNSGRSTPQTRRDFMNSAAVLVAGLGAARILHGQEAQPSKPKPRRIDVHSHMLPSFYKTIRQGEATGIGSSRSSAMKDWTPALAVEAMDKFGIGTSILSLAVGGVSFNGPEGSSLARKSNEYGAKAVSDYPGRFGLFAALPLPDQQASLQELVYALDVLKADGIALLSNYGDKWTGDPQYAPVFEELNRRGAVVFVHPTVPDCCHNLVPGVTPSMTEYLFDTTRAITSFLVNGTFTRFPRIQFIFCHSGGTITVLANRISRALSKDPAFNIPGGALGELKKLYFDTANASDPAPLGALRALVPISQILFGSDYPFVPIDATVEPLDRAALSESEQSAVNFENAERLFPRLNKVRQP